MDHPAFPVFLFVLLAVALALATLVLAHLLGPHRRNPVKLMPYESGMDPIGDARKRFDIRFSLVAIEFLVFDVELLFLYPWAVSSGGPSPVGPLAGELRATVFWGAMFFIMLLIIGFVYTWRKGVFQWR